MTPFQRAVEAMATAKNQKDAQYSVDACEFLLRSFLATLPELGLRIVPVEATEVQLRAAWHATGHEVGQERSAFDDHINATKYAAATAAAPNVMEE